MYFTRVDVHTHEHGPRRQNCLGRRRFRKIIKKHYDKFTDFELEKRFDLYERASKAFAAVVTSEADGNVILKKGPVIM